MRYWQDAVFGHYTMPCRFVSLVLFIEWCCKERTTDLRVIIRVSEESKGKTSRLISLGICVTISTMLKAD
jgi:hypothetical protein